MRFFNGITRNSISDEGAGIAGEGDDLPACQIVTDIQHQSLNALGVVSTVDDEQGIPAHNVKTAGPAHSAQTLPNVFFGNVPALIL